MSAAPVGGAMAATDVSLSSSACGGSGGIGEGHGLDAACAPAIAALAQRLRVADCLLDLVERASAHQRVADRQEELARDARPGFGQQEMNVPQRR